MGPSNYQVNNIIRSYSRKLTGGLNGQPGQQAETDRNRVSADQPDNPRDLEFMDRITAGVIGTVSSTNSEAAQANRQALHRVAASLQASQKKA